MLNPHTFSGEPNIVVNCMEPYSYVNVIQLRLVLTVQEQEYVLLVQEKSKWSVRSVMEIQNVYPAIEQEHTLAQTVRVLENAQNVMTDGVLAMNAMAAELFPALIVMVQVIMLTPYVTSVEELVIMIIITTRDVEHVVVLEDS